VGKQTAGWIACALLGAAACGTSADSHPMSPPTPGTSAIPATPSVGATAAGSPAMPSGPAAIGMNGRVPAAQAQPPAGSAGPAAPAVDPSAAAGSATGAPAPAGESGANPDAFNPYKDFKSDFYAQDSSWACKPGAANNPCETDLDATEILPDGTAKPAPEPAPTQHPIDCIYWYPTVSRSGAQDSRDFSNATALVDVTHRQAARFSRVCNLYAPFFRLVSIEQFMSGGDIDLAYADVVESFKYYIANLSEGRDFVLLGHSQGSNHGLRLLREELDDQPELLARMVSAVMLGFPVELPEGQATGGTFENIPICQSDQQRGCLINFMSFSAQSPPSSSGGNTGFDAIEVCTNPVALGGGPGLFQGTYFAAAGSPVASQVTTPWVLYRDFFRGECKRSGGTAYMEISYAMEAGDQRTFGMLSEISGIGLHVMDFTFSQGDLIELVRKQAMLAP
jgi:hypothetical protein